MSDRKRPGSKLPDRVGAQAREPMIIVYALLATVALPPEVAVFIGPVKITAYRLVLILAFIPCVQRLLGGKVAPFNAIDGFLLLFIAWAIMSLVTLHGVADAWQFAGLLFLETAGPYLIARCYITSAQGFRRFVGAYLAIVVVLLPFAIVESLTGTHVLRELARAAFGGAPVMSRPPRLGLDRAFGSFEHPILFGVFCATALGMLLHVPSTRVRKAMKATTVGAATFFSLSTGPLTALVSQLVLMTYDRVAARMGITRKWSLFLAGFVAAYVVVDLLSNRTPFHVFVTYLSFNIGSAYNRILIWEYGTQSVWNNPLLGVGLGEWERPHFMSPSMDNFWLVIAVRYGVPALLFLAAAIATLFYRTMRLKVEPDIALCRKGWAVSLAGLMIAGASVHLWASVYIVFMMMLGLSMWLLNVPGSTTGSTTGRTRRAEPARPEQAARTGRFGHAGSGTGQKRPEKIMRIGDRAESRVKPMQRDRAR